MIAKAGMRTVLAQRKYIGLMLIAWAPFVVRTGQAYAASNLPQAAILALKPETFRDESKVEDSPLFVNGPSLGGGA